MNIYKNISDNLIKESDNANADEFVRLFKNKYGEDSIFVSAWDIPETPENLYHGLIEEVPNDDMGYYDKFKDENGNFNPTPENVLAVVDFLLESKGPEANAQIITPDNPRYKKYAKELGIELPKENDMDYLKTCAAKLRRIDNKIDWEMDDAREYEHPDDFRDLCELRKKVQVEWDKLYAFCKEHGIDDNSLYDEEYNSKYDPDRFEWADKYYRDYSFNPDKAYHD